MTPNPHSRIRFSGSDPNRGLRSRLNLLLTFVTLQFILIIFILVKIAAIEKAPPVPVQQVTEQTKLETTQPSSAEVLATSEQSSAPLRETSPKETTKIAIPKEILETSPIRIQVLNGCGKAGIAGKAGKWLKKNGYNVCKIGNADRNDYKESRIIDRTGNMTTARKLAALLRINEIHIKQLKLMKNPDIDLTLILGKDFTRLEIGS